MKILHVVPSYSPAVRYGGPIYSVHGLAKASAAAGHQVDVATTNADGAGVLPLDPNLWHDCDGVRVRYFARTFPKRLFRAPSMAAWAAAHVREYDVVHIHAVFLWPIFRMARLCEAAGIPYVLSPRGMLVKDLFARKSGVVKSLWMRLFDRRTLERASVVHVTAPAESEELAKFGYAVPPIAVIPNGVDEPAEAAPDDAAIAADVAAGAGAGPFILSLGRINWKKNLVALVEAMKAVPDANLVIVGNDEDGDGQAILAAIASAGLEGRVRMVARAVEGADKDWLFRNCTAFVLPSISENFGNVVVEAMAYAKPIVVSSGCGVADIVQQAGCGIVCSPDAQDLAAALNRVSALPERERADMGKRGQHYVRQQLGWPRIAEQMIATYQQAQRSYHA